MTVDRRRSWDELGLPADAGLLARLVRVELLLRSAIDEITARNAITTADYLVLAVVRRSPNGLGTPTRICELLGRTTGGMSLTLDRLEAAGRLVRADHPGDRRRITVELTARGHTLVRRVNRQLHDWEASLDAAGLHTATTLVLDQLLDALESDTGFETESAQNRAGAGEGAPMSRRRRSAS